MSDINIKLITTISLLLCVLIMFLGCGVLEDDDYEPFEGGFHPFDDDGIGDHGAYLAANSYDFTMCTECHGEDLDGIEFTGTGEKERSCYSSECHTTTNHDFVHIVGIDEHSGYLIENNWDLSECFSCHTNLESGVEPNFGGSCSSADCHISDAGGAQACNNCHGDRDGDYNDEVFWAPPVSLAKYTLTDSLGVGAHRSHLQSNNYFASISCEACHEVPQNFTDSGHIDNSGITQAEINFGSISTNWGSSPEWDRANAKCSNTFCHFDAEPVWNEVDGTWSDCNACHGIPTGGSHPIDNDWNQCSNTDCHGNVYNPSGSLIPERHVNGFIFN